VPISIQFGTDTYQENVTLSAAEFYANIATRGKLPTTSQPAVGTFVETYRHLAKPEVEILSVHLTSKLSGTWQSACTAASLVQNQVKVTVVNSLAGSAGLGWMVHEAALLAQQGLDAATIKAKLEAKRADISIFFVIDTLEYAQMSGRVGRLNALLGSLLHIKPIIGLDNGAMVIKEKVRSKKMAMARLVALTQDKLQQQPVNIAVIHAQAAAQAQTLLNLAQNQLNVQRSYVQDLALSLAVHFGPGTLGLVAYPVTV
jgi:DegV family protein with EDD domain